MSNDSHSSFFNEGLDASNDGLGIKVTIEPLIEACLEVEEEQHHFTGLKPAVSAEDGHCCELKLIPCHIFLQSTTQTGICNQWNKPLGRSERTIHDINLCQRWRGAEIAICWILANKQLPLWTEYAKEVFNCRKSL